MQLLCDSESKARSWVRAWIRRKEVKDVIGTMGEILTWTVCYISALSMLNCLSAVTVLWLQNVLVLGRYMLRDLQFSSVQ